MNIIFSVFIVIFALVTWAECRSVQHRFIRASNSQYTTKYDNFDVDAVLKSKRLVYNYVNCLLDKSPCSPEGRLLKEYIPDALASDCSKCSETQKKQGGRVFSHLLLNYPKEWQLLLDKYDKDGNYRKKYEVVDDYEDDGDSLDEAK